MAKVNWIVGHRIYQKRLGVCHGDEMLYLFPFAMTGFPSTIKTEKGMDCLFGSALTCMTIDEPLPCRQDCRL